MNHLHRRQFTSRRALLASIAGVALLPSFAQSSVARSTQPDYWPTTGWRSAEPQDYGVDPAALEAVADRAIGEVPAISALLAVRGGYLVFERYFGSYKAGTPINVRSVTKSVTGTLTGAARQRRLIDSLERTVGDLIPDRIPAGADPN